MKKLFLYIFVSAMILIAPRGFAQTDTNSDFNPFPQMEQDQNSVDDDTASKPDEQNEDVWPPPESNHE